MKRMEAKRRRLARRFLRAHRKDDADWLGGALVELMRCASPEEIHAWAEQYMGESPETVGVAKAVRFAGLLTAEEKKQPDGKLIREVLDAINGILNT